MVTGPIVVAANRNSLQDVLKHMKNAPIMIKIDGSKLFNALLTGATRFLTLSPSLEMSHEQN
jgi:hypothetical protein